MRPHRLRMQAFGPYPGCVEIDLDLLGAGGLFLLHGETGSGKTSLLDGLGFALFGRVPGPRGRTGRLRCDLAAAGVRTEVELEFTLAGRRWRVTRAPAQHRVRSRGTGVTLEPARVLLQELRSAVWETVSTRLDEAAAELDPLLGMSADQFFQVVLLPQGEFARFLRADAKDRGELLQRLFATERFGAVERWLAERRAATAAAADTARQGAQILEACLAQAAGRPAGDGVADPTLLVAELELVRDGAKRSAEAAGAVRDAARSEADRVRRLADRQARRRAVLTTSTLLEQEGPAYRDLHREVQAAGRAAELAGRLAEADSRASAYAAATADEVAARALLASVGVATADAAGDLQVTADAARRRAGRLEGFRGLSDDLAAERAAARELAAQEDGVAVRVAGLQAARSGMPERQQRCQAVLEQVRAAAEGLPVAEASQEALAGALAEARGLAGATRLQAELDELLLPARETAVSLREKAGELRDARLQSMVAELAANLAAGAPCEVCGSVEHPDPYAGRADAVSREDEDRARLAAEHAAREVAELQSRRAAAAATAAGHRQRLQALGCPGDPVELARAVDVAAGVVQSRRAALRRLPVAQAAVLAVEGEIADCDSALLAAAAEQALLRRRHLDCRERAGRLAARLQSELDGAADLPDAVARANHVAGACEAAAAASLETARAQAEAARAAAAAGRAARAADFHDLVAARESLRSAAWREESSRTLRSYEDRRAALASALADPELTVPLEPAADPGAAVEALADADDALGAAVGALAAATSRVAEVAVLAPQLLQARAALEPLERQAGTVRRLADLCAGGGANALRMTLTSFVLAARLEEVASVASARLLQMTQGRYSLLHSDSTAKGGARSGLGLLARDAWTGQDRDVSTLSGGETFQASLALALALADVVQAEAGGTRIEALFVDEGFGSLDEQTLDEVMDVLDGLREGGRVVGVVSHVAELRARIPSQVHVHKGRRGSTLSVTGAEL